MTALEEFIAGLKRFLGFPKPSPAERINEATQDRPPPEQHPRSENPLLEAPAVETLVVETPVVQDASAIDEAPTESQAIPHVADEVAEIKALLEAMVEPPLAPQAATEAEAEIDAPEADSEAPVADSPIQTTTPLEPATPVAAPADGSLVLTLATPPTTFTLAKSGATLGRGEDNTIRLDDLSVSRRHARIAYRQSGYWLSDLGSMGGTWVGGTRLDAAHCVAADEVIDVGHYRLTVSFAGEPKASTPRRRPSRAR